MRVQAGTPPAPVRPVDPCAATPTVTCCHTDLAALIYGHGSHRVAQNLARAETQCAMGGSGPGRDTTCFCQPCRPLCGQPATPHVTCCNTAFTLLIHSHATHRTALKWQQSGHKWTQCASWAACMGAGRDTMHPCDDPTWNGPCMYPCAGYHHTMSKMLVLPPPGWLGWCGAAGRLSNRAHKSREALHRCPTGMGFRPRHACTRLQGYNQAKSRHVAMRVCPPGWLAWCKAAWSPSGMGLGSPGSCSSHCRTGPGCERFLAAFASRFVPETDQYYLNKRALGFTPATWARRPLRDHAPVNTGFCALCKVIIA